MNFNRPKIQMKFTMGNIANQIKRSSLLPSFDDLRVTIVMTIRENYCLTLNTIDSLIQFTTIPYRFIFVDYKTPENIIQEIRNKPNIEIITSNSPYPSTSMKSIIPLIKTPYTVYLDNNILFSPQWLENLIICMENSNNAGIVGPVYLWKTNLIHMFGGNITVKNGHFTEKHYLIDYPAISIKKLQTRKCDYVEYHCLMVRTDLLKQDILDDSLRVIHQHIDLSLMAKRLGYNTYTTPHSAITYVNEAPILDSEHELFRERWDIEAGNSDIDHFCKKWGFANDSGFDDVRNFLQRHNTKIR